MAFQGYGDPSLEFDPQTESLYMSYSWLITLETDPRWMRGVRSRLAVSRDNGQTFDLVKPLNTNIETTSSPSSLDGYLNFETTTLVRAPDGKWKALWIGYHVARTGQDKNGGVFFVDLTSTEETPESLDPSDSEVVYGTKETAAAYGWSIDVSQFPETASCTVITEPAYFAHNDTLYLGLNCLVFEGGNEIVESEGFFVFEVAPQSLELSLVAKVTDHALATELGADRFEQVDLSLDREGNVLLIGTPIDDVEVEGGTRAIHMGCYVLEFEDFAAGRLKRRANGEIYVRAVIEDSASAPNGPGACTYDSHSDAGVLMIRRNLPPASSNGVQFRLMKTNVTL